MGNDMNAAGPSRTGPHQTTPHQTTPHQTTPHQAVPQRTGLREPGPHESAPHESAPHEPGPREPGPYDPAAVEPDRAGPELRWPDAQQPDPLEATWQSVDQVFNDQSESDAPFAVPGTGPGTSANPPAGPVPPYAYGPTPQSPPPSTYEPTPPYVPVPVPVPAPAPTPAPTAGYASEEPAAGAGAVRTLGAPPHSGPKPPLYAPEPRELPSVREDPTAALTPDMVVDGAGYGALTVRAASVRGDSHRYQGEPRQDSLAVVRLGADGPDGLLLLAVADGVGSAARSHVGSQEACRLAAMELDAVSADLAETVRTGDRPGFAALVDTAVGRVATLLAHRARERGDDPAAYATTLRALLVPLDPRVRTRGFLAVGDGGTALLRGGEWNLTLTDPEHDGDGMIDTRTAALPHGHRARALLLAPALPGDVLVLCTDGLSTPLAGDAEMREFLGSGWGRGAAPSPADFLWQLQYRVKSYDDDRTAVVLWEAVP
ncbi:protein phosphatase 2C domain-containing protein [Streptomyces sp. NPDC096324]|uniref:protein phosphatase 2C domain-containing protein n=1 Tax=Streptomyces sp. NPDC096324 TaxID=3366085 RepID=UPI0037F484FC